MREYDFPFAGYPQVFQDPNEGTCVPICLYIAMKILELKGVQGVPDLTWSQIAKIIGTEADGTPLGDNIEKINEKMIATIPQYKFDINYGVIKWKSIIDDIHVENPLNTPVVAMIGQFDSQELNWMPHAVVLLHASDKYTVFFDPFYGEISEPTNSFFTKWLALDRYCVRLKHVPRTQRILEEYTLRKIGGENGSD